MLVKDVVNHNSARIKLSATVRQASELLSSSQAGDLMVVDDNNGFIGVLSEGDVLRACLPTLESLYQAGGLEAAAGLFDDKAKAVAGRPIEPLVLKNVVTLKLTDTVNVAAGIMLSKMIRRLPVVESGKLIGSVARADIARSAMAD